LSQTTCGTATRRAGGVTRVEPSGREICLGPSQRRVRSTPRCSTRSPGFRGSSRAHRRHGGSGAPDVLWHPSVSWQGCRSSPGRSTPPHCAVSAAGA
jgi:hypothetical protein